MIFNQMRSGGGNPRIVRHESIEEYMIVNNCEPTTPGIVTSIVELVLDEGAYVYDLTTANHHFQAGVGDLIVHNTDSIMITKGEKGEGWTDEEKENFLENGKAIVKRMNDDCFTYPILMVLDGGFRVMHSIAKKMYCYVNIDTDEPLAINPELWHSKGLTTSRRDSCLMMRRMYGDIARDITCLRPLEDVLVKIAVEITRLLRGELNNEEMITIKKLGSGYANPNYPLAIYMRHLHKIGMTVKPGDRVPYLIVERDNYKHQGELFESPEIVKRDQLQINRLTYLKSQFANKIDKLLYKSIADMIPTEFVAKLPDLLAFSPDSEVLDLMLAMIEVHINNQ
jgi:DNA polymerase elongation subunit (family B)